MLCSVWRHGLNAQNIISGFRSTGAFPVDKTKYKLSHLDIFKLQLSSNKKDQSCPKKRIQVKMNGTILTNRKFKEQVELLKIENNKTGKLKKANCFRQ